MNIDLTRLNMGTLEYVDIDESVTIEQDKLDSVGIINLKDTKVTGSISREEQGRYLECTISGIMIVPCSLTLKPVEHSFTTRVEGMIEQLFEEIGEIIKNNQNTIDILPIIWENILMEIPMKVISPEAEDIKVAGNGWRLITDEEDSKDINPEWEKLKDLL